jgi:hypothetical protein
VWCPKISSRMDWNWSGRALEFLVLEEPPLVKMLRFEPSLM